MAGLGLFSIWPSLPSAEGSIDPDRSCFTPPMRRDGRAPSICPGRLGSRRKRAQECQRRTSRSSPPHGESGLVLRGDVHGRGRPALSPLDTRQGGGKQDHRRLDLDAVLGHGQRPERTTGVSIGTTSGVWLSLEEANGTGIAGWGWTDNGYGMNVFGPELWFATTGTQTVRLQPREDGIIIDQIVLSASRYLGDPSGPSKNSTTILRRTRWVRGRQHSAAGACRRALRHHARECAAGAGLECLTIRHGLHGPLRRRPGPVHRRRLMSGTRSSGMWCRGGSGPSRPGPTTARAPAPIRPRSARQANEVRT